METSVWGLVITLSLAVFANIAALGALHYRGMLMIAKIRLEVSDRLTRLETSVAELTRVIQKNGFARKEDIDRLEETVEELRKAYGRS